MQKTVAVIIGTMLLLAILVGCPLVTVDPLESVPALWDGIYHVVNNPSIRISVHDGKIFSLDASDDETEDFPATLPASGYAMSYTLSRCRAFLDDSHYINWDRSGDTDLVTSAKLGSYVDLIHFVP